MADMGFTSSGIDYSGFYTGAMDPNAPFVRTPGSTGYDKGIGMDSPEEMYQQIYGEPLTSRSVKTYAVDDYGSPIVPKSASVSGRAGSQAGAGGYGAGSATYMPPPLPNQPRGSILTAKGSERLPMDPNPASTFGAFGYDAAPTQSSALSAINGATRGMAGAAGIGSGSLTASMPNRGAPVHQLNVDPPDEEGQFYADSMRMPVRTKSGKVYTPSGGAQSPQQRSQAKGSLSANDQRGPLSQLLGLKTSGLGGLLGGLFGGGQQQQGGGLAAMLGGMGGGGQITRAPLAGNPILVDPSTQAGSVLESMGYSSGAVLPSAVSDNLSKRGYI